MIQWRVVAAEGGNIQAEINLNRFQGLLLAFDGPFPSKENLLFSSKKLETSKIIQSTKGKASTDKYFTKSYEISDGPEKGRILIVVKYTSGSFGIQFDEICGGEHFIEPNSDLMIYSPFYPYQNPTPASAKFLFSQFWFIRTSNRSQSSHL